MIPWESIHTLGSVMNDAELEELEIEDEEYRIRLNRGGQPVATSATVPSEAPGAEGEPSAAAESTAPSGSSEDWISIDSPMVGTFYEAPAPDADPFVEVGDHVNLDTTVCIIEAMKLMNEIEAECEGVIKEVCKDDAEPVSKGDTLFYVEPD
ncbi:MAG: acetyl-CoA carboxylase biotin carboxyl carrier protein [bacterium]